MARCRENADRQAESRDPFFLGGSLQMQPGRRCTDEMKVRRTLSTEEATEDCRRLEPRRAFVGNHDRGEQSLTVHCEMDGVGDCNIDARCRQVARVSDLVEVQGHRQGRQNIGGLLRIRVSRCTERLHERLAERMTQRRADSPKVRDQLATSECECAGWNVFVAYVARPPCELNYQAVGADSVT